MIVGTASLTAKLVDMAVTHILWFFGTPTVVMSMADIPGCNSFIIMLMTRGIRCGRGNSPHYMTMTICDIGIDAIAMNMITGIFTFTYTFTFTMFFTHDFSPLNLRAI
jgi:hypothetical protein